MYMYSTPYMYQVPVGHVYCLVPKKSLPTDNSHSQ